MTPKQIINILLILLTIFFVGYSIWLAMDGNDARASYFLIWALVVELIIRRYVGA